MATPEQLQQIRDAIAEETRLIAELKAKKAASLSLPSATSTSTIDQTPMQIGGAGNVFLSKQGLYDIGTAGVKGFAGLADLITLPAVAIARTGGINLPYFGVSKMLEQDLAALAPSLGVKEKTPLQEFGQFVLPVSKGNLIRQALTGATMYGGKEAAEALVPNSPGFQVGASIAAPLLLALGRKGGQAASKVGAKLSVVPPTLEQETESLIKSIDTDVAKLSSKPVEPASRTAVTSGAEQIRNIQVAKEQMKAKAREGFQNKEVFNTPIDSTGIQDDISSLIANWSVTHKTEIPPALSEYINKLIAFEKPQLGSALAAFVPESMTPPAATLGELWQLQQKVGKLLPKTPSDALTPEQTLAYGVYNYINELIDKTPGGQVVADAKQLWKNYREAFVYDPALKQRAPLATAQRKESEKIDTYFSGGSSRFEALQKGGVDITPLQNQLVNDFLSQRTPAAKLKWIEEKRPALQTAPFWPTFENAFTALEAQLKKEAPVASKPTKDLLLKSALATGLYNISPTVGSLIGAGLFLKDLPKTTYGNILTTLGSPLQKLPEVSLVNALTRGAVAEGQAPEATPFRPAIANKQANVQQIDQAIKNIESKIEAKTKGKPTQVSALIEKQSPLVKAVIEVESKGKPQAKSGKGATGLMQLMPSTAKALGVDPKDPAQNIEGGKKYLAQMQEQFKNDKLALAAYNWGPANLNRAIAKTKKAGLKPTWENILQVAFVPAETQKYVSKVLTLKNKYNA